MAKGTISTGRIAENRKARHEYQIEEKVEAGLILLGSEVKSLRNGRASIAESYAGEDRGGWCCSTRTSRFMSLRA